METVMLSVGVDLGQQHDPTALALVELVDRSNSDTPDIHFECRHLERLPLKTRYPDVARRIAEVQRNAIQAARQRAFERNRTDADVWITTWVDATGALPAIDILNEQGIQCVPCFFNFGDRRTEHDGKVSIGKAWLVSRLNAQSQSGRVHLPPDHAEAAAMMRELADYEIKVDQDANDRYGAFKVGSHDDLVTALGLAVQVTPRPSGWEKVAEQMTQGYAR